MKYAMVFLTAIIAAFLLYETFQQKNECSKSGGVFVRSMFGYECLKTCALIGKK